MHWPIMIPVKMLKSLHPKRIFTLLDAIDSAPPSYTLSRPQALRRVFVVLACVSVCLLMIHYLKYFSTFKAFLELLSHWQGQGGAYWLHTLSNTDYFRLISYGWWTFWHVIGYVVIPCLVIKYLLKARIADMGWRLNDSLTHWRGYLLLLTPILFFIFLVSQGEDFVNHYPFYKQAGRSWFDLLAWELMYLLQFICLEFFFRGFMLHALRPAVGANAVWIMCVPYLMIHFPKLWLEATGAILFGLFLGILALRSNSIWGGVVVHAGIAVSMDVAALVQQSNVPSRLFP